MGVDWIEDSVVTSCCINTQYSISMYVHVHVHVEVKIFRNAYLAFFVYFST